MEWSKFDTEMMAAAIKLAKKGRYTTSPNPHVGCVVTLDEQIVGEGYHRIAGEAHAEVYALQMAKERAKGATVYVTLEPCSHHGRTPPCADALIKQQVARVVVAIVDPNTQVAGSGIKRIRAAGIKVDVGLLEKEASELNAGFIKRMKTNLPRVSIKLAASLDGKIALSNGVSQWITSPDARRDVQRMRARHDVIITGIETVLADNPSLNVRYDELGHLKEQITPQQLRQPLRVVLDSRARLTHAAKIFSINSPILLVSCQGYPPSERLNWPHHVDWLHFDAIDGRVPLDKLLKHLGQQYNTVMVEAGATLAGAFINQQLADELVLYQAPKIIGNHGINLINLPDYTQMAQLPEMTLIDDRKIGTDRRYRFNLTQDK